MSAEKQITVVIAGTGEYKDLAIEPGTTAQDVLAAIELPDYALSKGGGEAPFAAADNVYPKVDTGAKLYVAPPAEAG